MENTISMIKKHKIISIVRLDGDHNMLELVESLYKGGIRIVEVTLNTENALRSIREIKEKYPQMLVGAGTVLDEIDVKNALNSGASFLLSPILDKKSIEMANKHNVLMVPGVFTPTEALRAYEYGARMLKLFPARSVGPSYVSDLKGPLSELDIMAVGGVHMDNAREFLEKGSCSLGIGSSIVSNKDVAEGNFLEIEKKAREFVKLAEAVE